MIAMSLWASAAEPVYSSNIVGYQKISLGADKIEGIGVQFRNIGGTAINIQDLFAADVTNLTSAGNAGAADTIQIWDGVNNKYDIYFLHNGSGKNASAKKDKWIDNATGNIADVDIDPGTGFFFTKVGSAATVTISGEIIPDTIDSMVLPTGITMITAPFTCDYEINSDSMIDWLTAGTSAGNAGAADTIQIWDSANNRYNIYFLHNGSGKNASAKKGKWVDNATGNIADLVIPMGQALFYTSVSETNKTIDVVSPY